MNKPEDNNKEFIWSEPKQKYIEVAYIEPADYIPKELREKFKLGEFADDDDEDEEE
ncbi:MAG: hypothetical protein MJ145_01485 [Clostridia bacterium]|nr:hypothetical protein [Clostridia bacterium]